MAESQRALAALAQLQDSCRFGPMTTNRRKQIHVRTPPPTTKRLTASLNETPYVLYDYLRNAESRRGTVLYLAYGSNLSNETFRGSRGIRPLSQINVQVPSLRMTFDLPGLPYAEPCFANSARRDPKYDPSSREQCQFEDEKTPLLFDEVRGQKSYSKDQWHKGLIGVVYEVTPEDYAHIIATEGGGSSYTDILVDCHPFASSDPGMPVPQDPALPPFKAHTLYAPVEDPPKDHGRLQRPNPGYAQASARYLKLITDGAEELGLPFEYQDYLHSLRPFTITTNKQRLGQFVFLMMWAPIVLAIFGMNKIFADDNGVVPVWLRELLAAVFKGIWASYDNFFRTMFGDGERTIGDGADETSNIIGDCLPIQPADSGDFCGTADPEKGDPLR
ncbi:gamma-glutamylcyclotransferase [Teratosphaeria destructans]|uniref:gamma-glutamylcyclotransferase n=1 Tax=Teratosphaeria destructans TaxID=418781 RepID=A0A9W7W037_9PEZI|nr:gamma-glutamylcyclotransferase [Teratosphaeria destructans]